jgi:hypothetical protein
LLNQQIGANLAGAIRARTATRISDGCSVQTPNRSATLFELSEAGWLANALFVAVVLQAIPALSLVGYFDCSITPGHQRCESEVIARCSRWQKRWRPSKRPKFGSLSSIFTPTALGDLIPRGSRSPKTE